MQPPAPPKDPSRAWRALCFGAVSVGRVFKALLGSVFSQSLRGAAVIAILVATALFSAPKAQRIGDNLQIALPLAAWGCAAVNGRGAEFFGRYAVMFLGAHAVKIGLGPVPMNIRPSGGGHGFPSAHSSTASLGATTLVRECLMRHPLAQGAAIVAAGFTGASRIEANAHDIWQVLAGWLWGIGCALIPVAPIGRGLLAVWALVSWPVRTAIARARR